MQKKQFFLVFSAFVLASSLPSASIVFAKSSSSSIKTINPPDIIQPAKVSRFATRFFAPYMYVEPSPNTNPNNKPNLFVQAALQTGIKYYTLAFIISNGCKGMWGDFTEVGKLPPGVPAGSPDLLMAGISQLRKSGGDVIISFGGANGIELGQACQDVSSLQLQYQQVINTYHVTHLDFDIEGASIADPISVDRRNKALASLERANPSLSISYTLPVLPTGLTDGVKLLQNARTNKVKVAIVNIMTMDYGQASDHMGDDAINAAKSVQGQLASIRMSAKIGITPMIGINDTSTETFTLSDARKVLNFAKQNTNIGELSMWSLGRDKPCAGGASGSASTLCSSIAQKRFDFTKVFGQFTSSSLPTSIP